MYAHTTWYDTKRWCNNPVLSQPNVQKYKRTENQIRKIINRDVEATQENGKVNLRIYYKNRKLKNLFIKNNELKPLEESSVVYKYICDQETCLVEQRSYIGCTTVTIKERFKQHAGIKKHYLTEHGRNITGSEMLPNVSVIARSPDPSELYLLEALIIKEYNPIINAQINDFNRTLKIFN